MNRSGSKVVCGVGSVCACSGAVSRMLSDDMVWAFLWSHCQMGTIVVYIDTTHWGKGGSIQQRSSKRSEDIYIDFDISGETLHIVTCMSTWRFA